MLKLTESCPVTGRQTPRAAHLYTVNYHTNLICTHTGSWLHLQKYLSVLPLFSQYKQTLDLNPLLNSYFVQTVNRCRTVTKRRANKAQIPLSFQN